MEKKHIRFCGIMERASYLQILPIFSFDFQLNMLKNRYAHNLKKSCVANMRSYFGESLSKAKEKHSLLWCHGVSFLSPDSSNHLFDFQLCMLKNRYARQSKKKLCRNHAFI